MTHIKVSKSNWPYAKAEWRCSCGGYGLEWRFALAADEARRHLFEVHGVETRTFHHRPALDRNRAADLYDATAGTSETPATPGMGAGDFPRCEAVRSPHTPEWTILAQHRINEWTTSYHEGARA